MKQTKGAGLAWNLILFLSGVLLSALFSTWLSNLVTSQYIFLAVIVVLLALTVIFFISIIHTQIKDTNEYMKGVFKQAISTVEYYDETYRENEGIEYRGIIFSELSELIKSAEKEILILGATRHGEKPYKGTDHEQRKNYHRVLEEKIKDNLAKEFRYIRINQVRQDIPEQLRTQYIGSTLLEHFEKIANIKRECKNLKATIDILNVPLQYWTSIWFIDGISIVVEIVGITEDDSPYVAGLIRITDKGGNISLKFKKLFDELQRKGQPIKL
ncbi:MAG: hypothetical protein AAFR26_19875 [Cyanobacteria bacterium J06626_4]